MIRLFLAALLVLLLQTAQAAGTLNTFQLKNDASGGHSSAIRLAPTYVNARSLAANVAESATVPTGARWVVFSSTCNFYANSAAAATVPGDVTDGSAAELNPAAWYVEGVTTISVIASVACVVTFAYYK